LPISLGDQMQMLVSGHLASLFTSSVLPRLRWAQDKGPQGVDEATVKDHLPPAIRCATLRQWTGELDHPVASGKSPSRRQVSGRCCTVCLHLSWTSRRHVLQLAKTW